MQFSKYFIFHIADPIIIVRKEGAAESHKDFRVRWSIVLSALQWLVENNIYYHDVTIDHSVLELLPVDGELTNLCTVRTSSNEVDAVYEGDIEDPYSANLERTFVPISMTHLTEQEAINQSVMASGNSTPVSW